MPPQNALSRSPAAAPSGRGGELVLAVYRGLARLLSPAIPIVLARRAKRGKADPKRTPERYGMAGTARPDGRVAWVHAASVGETIAVLPLIERLLARGIGVVFTSGTVTSAAIAAARLPKGAIHQYPPLDVPAYVERFLGHWQPEIAIIAESEVWPATISTLNQRGTPIVIVNGRLSDRSFRRWTRFRSVVAPIFGRVSLVLAQSEEDGRRFAALGARSVVVSGNLKWDAPPLEADLGELARLREAVGGRPAWIAASTHAGEEEMVVAAHRRLQEAMPRLLTVIVPRHPQRGAAVAAILASAGVRGAQRSKGETPDTSSEVYLADTLGELGLFYRLAPIAFIGNSLVKGGGHNPAEATELGAAVVSGPYVENFSDVFARLVAAVPATVVRDSAELAAAIGPLLGDPAIVARWAAAQSAAVGRMKGALEATLTAIEPYLVPKATA